MVKTYHVPTRFDDHYYICCCWTGLTCKHGAVAVACVSFLSVIFFYLWFLYQSYAIPVALALSLWTIFEFAAAVGVVLGVATTHSKYLIPYIIMLWVRFAFLLMWIVFCARASTTNYDLRQLFHIGQWDREETYQQHRDAMRRTSMHLIVGSVIVIFVNLYFSVIVMSARRYMAEEEDAALVRRNKASRDHSNSLKRYNYIAA